MTIYKHTKRVFEIDGNGHIEECEENGIYDPAGCKLLVEKNPARPFKSKVCTTVKVQFNPYANNIEERLDTVKKELDLLCSYKMDNFCRDNKLRPLKESNDFKEKYHEVIGGIPGLIPEGITTILVNRTVDNKVEVVFSFRSILDGYTVGIMDYGFRKVYRSEHEKVS